jgi:ABC-2 type transport system permease protein
MTMPLNAASARPASQVRPYFWSVRRELWEHRALYIAPLIAAGVVMFGVLIGALNLHHFHHVMTPLTSTRRQEIALASFGFAALAIMATGVIVGVFYCLGALHNERRDRSVLFWKSLPVSDLITVLAKASVPLAILPVIVFVVTVALQLCMLATMALFNAGPAADAYPPLLWLVEILLYGLAVQALWYAPLWAWLLLVSAWARRAPFLWAFLPPLALVVVEKVAFGTNNLWSLITYRLGALHQAFRMTPGAQHGFDMPQPDPAGFLGNVDLWTGLVVAAAFLAGAVWVRRYREPI